MKRWLLNVLAAVSLVACVATVALWTRSYSRWEEAGWQARSGRIYSVTSRLGGLSFDITDGWPLREVWDGRTLWDSDPLLIQSLPPPSEWSLIGFGLNRSTQGIGIAKTGWTGRSSSVSIVIPHWAIAMIAATLPALFVFRFVRRRRRQNRGLCLTCGYDLRATTDRCPECGSCRNRRITSRCSGPPRRQTIP